MAINLSRNTRLWVSTVDKDGTHTPANTFEIPVQDGYSLSQSVSSSDVTVEEAGPVPTRGSKRFNDTLDPVEWSFTTYNTPYLETNHYVVDMLLWHALASGNSIALDLDNTSTSAEVYGDATSFKVGFANNAAHVLTKLYLYFKIDNQMYYVANAQVNEAAISVDITDISQTAWSGQAISYEPIADPAFVAAGGAAFDSTSVAPGYVRISPAKKYLVNKLTVMELNADVAPSANDYYSIPITSASITISNNITYLTPSTLAEVDKPIGSFTGTFDVSGSVEAYLRKTGGDGTSGNGYGSAELLEHMLSTASGSVTNTANLVLYINGKNVGEPQMIITIPTGHLSIPEVSVDSVVSTSFELKGIPNDADLQSGTEVSLEIKAG